MYKERYKELLIERETLKEKVHILMINFMAETDIGEANKILTEICDLNKRIESVNCKLVHTELLQKFSKEES